MSVLHDQAQRLIALWRSGALGGEAMPEDVHPDLPRDSMALLHYFTLPMALNYQRNSYKLWPAATAAFEDRPTAWLFTPADVVQRSVEDLRDVKGSSVAACRGGGGVIRH